MWFFKNYFTGIYLSLPKVSILVLMDVVLQASYQVLNLRQDIVSILVLMDVVLQVKQKSVRLPDFLVSILVLMDVVLQVKWVNNAIYITL